MNIYTDTSECFDVRNTYITIGTFDGVHKGHQKVIRSLLQLAEQNNAEALIFTFWPHPRNVLSKDGDKIELLNTLDERIELIKETGIEHLFVQNFSSEFSNTPYHRFISNILIDKLNMDTLVIGHDNKFGKDGKGDAETLIGLSKKLNFAIKKFDALIVNEINVSSSKIRKALNHADIKTANQYLSYNYFINGTVIKGNQIGRKIGFPTANLMADGTKLIPANGVYAVYAYIAAKRYLGMANIGYRPTVKEAKKQKNIEVHIFNFGTQIYGEQLRIEFVEKVRDEVKFDNFAALKHQLYNDRQQIISFFNL